MPDEVKRPKQFGLIVDGRPKKELEDWLRFEEKILEFVEAEAERLDLEIEARDVSQNDLPRDYTIVERAGQSLIVGV